MILRVSLTPKSSANQIDGVVDKIDGPALKVRVTAVPEKGKANAALIKLLAKSLAVAAGRISVLSGSKDRQKKLLIADTNAVERDYLEAFARERAPK